MTNIKCTQNKTKKQKQKQKQITKLNVGSLYKWCIFCRSVKKIEFETNALQSGHYPPGIPGQYRNEEKSK